MLVWQIPVVMIDYALKGQNICMFPEGTWNITPSKPMLSLYWGIIDIARNTGCPIIPLVLEYRGERCYIKWGEPVNVSEKDSKQDKINELSDKMATLKWEIWKTFPIICRTNVFGKEWDVEIQRRILEYSKLGYEYEKSCVRTDYEL